MHHNTASTAHSLSGQSWPPGTVGAFVWHYVKQYKGFLILFLLTALIWAIDISLRPYLLKLIIDGASSTASSNWPRALVVPSMLYLLMSIMLNLNMRIYNYACLRLYPALRAAVTHDLFAYLLQHSYAYFQDHSAGSLTRKIIDVTSNVDKLIHIPNENFYPQLFALFISCGTLYVAVHPLFGAIIILWSLSFVLLSYYASKKLMHYSRTLSKANTQLGGTLTDSVSNVMATKLFANSAYELSYVDKEICHVAKAYRKLRWKSLWIDFYQGLAMTLFIGSMLIALMYGRTQGWVTPGDFAFVLTLSVSFFWSIYNVGRQMKEFAKVVGICDQGLSILRTAPAIVDAPNAISIKITRGEIVYDNVTFAYKEKPPLFQDLSITLAPGQRVGLVGHSGGGKSTFIKLILRLVEPEKGAIRIDGQNIAQVTQHSLRTQIATIPQEPALFHRSVMDNIHFARIGATDKEVIEAAKRAHCHEFITSLPHGYQTLVGERGTKLSGGQRQRIAIARAMLADAPILLLDEATSALDSETEQAVATSLHSLMENRTTIAIAHRLSTLKDMERILVFDQGTIAQDGTPATLLQDQEGILYRLWHLQAQGFLPDDD